MKLVSFLSKENYIPPTVLIILFTLTLLTLFLVFPVEPDKDIIYVIFNLILLIFSAIIVFFSKIQNEGRDKTSFVLYLFLLMALSLFYFGVERDVVIANLLVLIGLQKTLHFNAHTGGRKLKIFENVFLFCSASLFFEECFWFILIPLMEIMVYNWKKISYWVVPILSVCSLYILILDYHLIFDIPFHYQIIEIQTPIMKPIDPLFFKMAIPFLVIICIGFFINIYLISYKSKFQNYRKKLWFIMGSLVISVFISLFRDNRIDVFLFSIFPLSVIFTNLISIFKTELSKEISIWVITFAVLSVSIFFQIS